MTRIVNVRFRGTRAQAVKAVRDFVSDLSGNVETRPQRELAGSIAKDVFGENRRQFLKKSRAGADDFGETWKPLADSTVRRKLAKQKGKVTAGQNRRFKSLQERNRKRAAALGLRIVEAMKQADAAALAGAGIVPINIETRRLIKSITPGGGDGLSYRKPREQVFRLQRRTITLGSSVEYTKYVQKARRIMMTAKEARGTIAKATSRSLPAIIRVSRLGN